MIKSNAFVRTIRTVIATATIAGTLTLAFTGPSFAASSRSAAVHATHSSVVPYEINHGGGWQGYATDFVGTGKCCGYPWIYDYQTHTWYAHPFDPVFDTAGGGLRYVGTDYLSNAVSLHATGFMESAQSLEVYGKTNVLEGVNLYESATSGKTATLVKSVAAPSGANGATLSFGSNPKMPEDVITFKRDGVAMGQPFSIAANQVNGIDTVVHRMTKACSGGYISPPIEVVPTLANSTTAPQAGRPVLLPCKEKFPNRMKLLK